MQQLTPSGWIGIAVVLAMFAGLVTIRIHPDAPVAIMLGLYAIIAAATAVVVAVGGSTRGGRGG